MKDYYLQKINNQNTKIDMLERGAMQRLKELFDNNATFTEISCEVESITGLVDEEKVMLKYYEEELKGYEEEENDKNV